MTMPPFAPARPFYAWEATLKECGSGTLLRHEVLDTDELIPGAAVGWRLLYVSTGHAGKKVAVSGVLFLPAVVPSGDGFRVISYAHGTVGITAAAAPSLNPNAEVLGFPIFGEVAAFLEAGYAAVCTDYEGLGTAGPHPYLHGPMQAHCQTDAVRAARQVTDALSAVWVAMGQSQGGHAALFTAASATSLAPELDYRGAVATAPPSEWATLVAETTDLGRILTPLVLHACTFYDGALEVEAFLNEDGLALLNSYRTSFLLAPGTVLDDFALLFGKALLRTNHRETSDREAALRLAQSLDLSPMEPPVVALDRPLLLAEGGTDEFIVPGTIERLAHSLREAGSQVEFHHHAGIGHLELPASALVHTLPFVHRIAPPN